jgi:hypothetical protein
MWETRDVHIGSVNKLTGLRKRDVEVERDLSEPANQLGKYDELTLECADTPARGWR